MIVHRGKAPNGATVLIDDGLCASKGSEEEGRIIEEQRRAAYEILCGEARMKGEEAAACSA